MKALFALLFLGIAQLSAVRYVSLGDVDEQLGAFSMQVLDGWTPKAPGEKLGHGMISVREPTFAGPRGMVMHILWQQKPDPDVLKAAITELDGARTRDPEAFRDVNIHGLHGGLYTLVHRSRLARPVWIIAKMTHNKELVNLTIESDRPFKPAEMDQVETMVRSIEPYGN